MADDTKQAAGDTRFDWVLIRILQIAAAHHAKLEKVAAIIGAELGELSVLWDVEDLVLDALGIQADNSAHYDLSSREAVRKALQDPGYFPRDWHYGVLAQAEAENTPEAYELAIGRIKAAASRL